MQANTKKAIAYAIYRQDCEALQVDRPMSEELFLDIFYKSILMDPKSRHRLTQAERRFQIIRHMHELMTLANDEYIYMEWIHDIPDEPTENDFIDIALQSDADWNDLITTFARLIQSKNYL